MHTFFISRTGWAFVELQIRAITVSLILFSADFVPRHAHADSPAPPRAAPISYALPVVRDAVFNADALVAQPVANAAWIATVRIGVSDHGDDSRLLWSTALSTARSAFAYDVSKEIETSTALVKGYADEALRAALSDDDISELFSFFRSPAGRQYLDFEREVDGIVDYAGSRVLLKMALGQPLGEVTTTSASRADFDSRRNVLELSRSAAMLKGADRLISSSDRLTNYGPAPWDAVLKLITAPNESSTDALLVHTDSLDRLAKIVGQISAVNQRDSFKRARMAAQQAEMRWLSSPERDHLVKDIAISMSEHLPCWQSLFRDNKEIQCVTFTPH